jgi:exo-beta-1,3-glucanase (GH17 family)
MSKNAKDIIGNNNYPAISYGGYRGKSREVQPSIEDIKEDLQIMFAQGFRVIRTYDLHHPFAENTLKAISELKNSDSDFEMYVMLGAWIQCKDAFTDLPIHNEEDLEGNKVEIAEAVRLAQDYQDIVKVIAVGNEAMVHWATSYHLEPKYVLKWVKYLQDLKINGTINNNIWITSSDNFASWGGGSEEYHNDDLDELIRSVDYVSMHTYAFHDTYYNPVFWNLSGDSEDLSKKDIIKKAIQKAVEYELSQFNSVQEYIHGIDSSKQVHIGETGWSSVASDLYGYGGTEAADEYKLGLYYEMITDVCVAKSISCFYFSAFDEPWKDSQNENGSENHFGLFTVHGEAKYPLWKKVDQNVFDGLSRGGNPIKKTFNGDFDALLETSNLPPINK